jgi:hypothetical protein
MSTRATPGKPLRARPPGTAFNWRWSSTHRPNAASCCCRAAGGGGTQLRLGCPLPPTGQRLRATLANPRRLPLLRLRLPHARQNLQNAQLKSLTGSRLSDVGQRARRRVAYQLLPFVFLLYIVNYVDRVNVPFANLRMSADRGLSDCVYGLGVGMFYITYVLFEIPDPSSSNAEVRENGLYES